MASGGAAPTPAGLRGRPPGGCDKRRAVEQVSTRVGACVAHKARRAHAPNDLNSPNGPRRQSVRRHCPDRLPTAMDFDEGAAWAALPLVLLTVALAFLVKMCAWTPAARLSADSDKTPSPEGVAPVEGEAPAPLTNGDSAAPEPPAEPALAQQEEPVKADVAPSTVQPVQEEAVAHKEEAPLQVAQSAQQEEQPPVKEEPKPVKEEPKPAEEELPAATVEEEAVDTQPEAVEVVEPSIEVPPPLPASNPPSPVTVFAESTKAEAALTSGQLPLEEAEPVAQVAQIPLPVEQEVAKPDPSPSMEELPPAPPSPVPEVEPPAEPAEEEGPATPPPTLCPIFRQSRCPACRKQFPKAWRPSRFRPWTWSPPPSPTRPRRPQQRRRSPMATSTATARRHLSQRPRPRSPLNRLMPIKSAKSSRRPAIFRLTARWPRPRNSQWAGPKSRAGAFPGGPAPTTVRATNNQGPNKTETAIFQLLLNATVGVGARKFY
ncbi:proteoglycan 4 isoform X2 [Dendroctonus ponderosae]|uniref:proteoglycan 4 isoform X2 n=1 Tax=Dendroctonus ponderosae TaxID=77166 RepID=UPI002034AED2|nr:proteoglycan 4 isoform X2 [Dendroctonus ponderosae]